MDKPGSTALSDDGRIWLLASGKNWIEGEAVSQLKKTAELPGMRLAVGLPDLHRGRGHPVGAAFVTEGVFYPQLIGNYAGCGMGLWQTGLRRQKFKLDRHEEAKREHKTEQWTRHAELERAIPCGYTKGHRSNAKSDRGFSSGVIPRRRTASSRH